MNLEEEREQYTFWKLIMIYLSLFPSVPNLLHQYRQYPSSQWTDLMPLKSLDSDHVIHLSVIFNPISELTPC